MSWTFCSSAWQNEKDLEEMEQAELEENAEREKDYENNDSISENK